MNTIECVCGLILLAREGYRISLELELSILAPMALETQIYSAMLDDIGGLALKGTFELPESARLALRHCRKSLYKLTDNHERYRSKHHSSSKHMGSNDVSMGFSKNLDDYRRSVDILRDIVTNAVSQENLARESNGRHGTKQAPVEINTVVEVTRNIEDVQKQVKQLTQDLSRILRSQDVSDRSIRINTRFTGKHTHDADSADSKAVNTARSATDTDTSSRTARVTLDNFAFDSNIMDTRKKDKPIVRARAILDPHRPDNWISNSAVSRAGLQGLIRKAPSKANNYYSIEGSFAPTGILTVSWTTTGATLWHTVFLVLDNAPFDMVLGNKFIEEEGSFVFVDPPPPTARVAFKALSKEERHQMALLAQTRARENEELSRARDARDAAAHEERRAARAAALKKSPPATPSSMTRSSSRATPSARSDVANHRQRLSDPRSQTALD